MSTQDDAVAELKVMGEHVQAGRHAEAAESAREVIQIARGVENKGAAVILVAAASGTWLTSRAVVDPSDEALPGRCDRVFDRFSKMNFGQAVIASIIALGVKIQVLLQAGQADQAEEAANQLIAFYSARPRDEKDSGGGAEAVRIASNMVAMAAPVSARRLAQAVVDRLSGSEIHEEAVLAASAQAWVIIATMASGEPVAGAPSADTPDELRALLDADDPPGIAAAGETTDKLINMGDAAIQAIDKLLPRLRGYGPHWDVARVMLSMLRIAAQHELGRTDDYRASERAFIDEFADQEDWRVTEVVAWYERDLAKAA